METDSVVFEIFDSVKIDPLAKAISPTETYREEMPTPNSPSLPQPATGKKLIMFGAARCGMIGICTDHLVESADDGACGVLARQPRGPRRE